MSGNSRLILLLAREPLKHSNADLSNTKDTLALIQDMVVEYLSPFFVASNSASLLWYRLHSAAIPPVALKTNGVNNNNNYCYCCKPVDLENNLMFAWLPNHSPLLTMPAECMICNID